MLEMLFGSKPIVEAEPGQKLFTVATTSWIVPDGVKSICAVCIGAGSRAYLSGTASGGMGGALRWLNAIPVTPGETLTVQVGQAASNLGYTTGSVGPVNGGDTTILRGSTVLLRAAGGRQTKEAQLAACINGQGGLGGTPITGSSSTGLPGSGAAGYFGDGGGGAANAQPESDTSAGKAGGVSSNTVNGQTITSGANGAGTRGQGAGVVAGTAYGAGGGSARRSSDNAKAYSNTGPGGCRIIWGTDRSYPSNAVDV